MVIIVALYGVQFLGTYSSLLFDSEPTITISLLCPQIIRICVYDFRTRKSRRRR
jgi:hypothetical protein